MPRYLDASLPRCLTALLPRCLAGRVPVRVPDGGGQYHWVVAISWKSWAPIWSWITGWINVVGWIALVAFRGPVGQPAHRGIISFMNPSYISEPWQQFLIYIRYNVVAFLANAFLTEILPHITKAAFIWSITGFVIVSITLLACVFPTYSSREVVFREFINETGWRGGIAWLLGLQQAGLGLTGYDVVAHMIEAIANAAVEGPRIMVVCVGIGIFTGFVFLTVLLFVAGSIDDVISSSSGPLLQIFYNATKNQCV
jgi:choline transport protein